jgi:hypothetical protein
MPAWPLVQALAAHVAHLYRPRFAHQRVAELELR